MNTPPPAARTHEPIRTPVRPWSDERFLSYVESHAHAAERPLFTPRQLDRLCLLADVMLPRVEEDVVNGTRYPVLPPKMADTLVARARARLLEKP